MPPGTDRARDSRLLRRLADLHLPQGAPTSLQLANLVAFSLERRHDGYARAFGARYTRYADDLTFSGGPSVARRSEALITGVDRIVEAPGFQLNKAKTRTRWPHQRQSVTGIVVNEHPNLARADVDHLRAILHDCRGEWSDRGGGSSRAQRFWAHLRGRISWVNALNPARGARLLEMCEAVDWER